MRVQGERETAHTAGIWAVWDSTGQFPLEKQASLLCIDQVNLAEAMSLMLTVCDRKQAHVTPVFCKPSPCVRLRDILFQRLSPKFELLIKRQH